MSVLSVFEIIFWFARFVFKRGDRNEKLVDERREDERIKKLEKEIRLLNRARNSRRTKSGVKKSKLVSSNSKMI